MNLELSEQIFSKFCSCPLTAGFSGGADSTAALLLALKFQKQYHFPLEAVHFNHHLRGSESDKEAQNAAEFARAHNVHCRIIDLHFEHTSNVESAAREARLAAWKCLIPANGAVILGHHADDKAESMLIRLCRGANVSGVTALRPETHISGVTLLRPLLNSTRREIEEFLHEEGVFSWAQDSSNSNPAYLRNFWRQKLAELRRLFPAAPGGLYRAAEVLKTDAEFIEQYAANLPGDRNSLAFWRSLHPALTIRLLRDFTGNIPDAELLARFQFEVSRTHSEPLYLEISPDCTLCFQHETLMCLAPAPEPMLWNWKQTSVCTWGKWRFSVQTLDRMPENPALNHCCFSRVNFPEIVELALPEAGTKILPFGKKTEEKLKKLRVDRKIPAAMQLPVLRAQGCVLWAPLLRQTAHFPVAPGETEILQFTIEENHHGTNSLSHP